MLPSNQLRRPHPANDSSVDLLTGDEDLASLLEAIDRIQTDENPSLETMEKRQSKLADYAVTHASEENIITYQQKMAQLIELHKKFHQYQNLSQCLSALNKLKTQNSLCEQEQLILFKPLVDMFYKLYPAHAHDPQHHLHPLKIQYTQPTGWHLPQFPADVLQKNFRDLWSKLKEHAVDLAFQFISELCAIYNPVNLESTIELNFSQRQSAALQEIGLRLLPLIRDGLRAYKEHTDTTFRVQWSMRNDHNVNLILRPYIQMQSDFIDKWQMFLHADQRTIQLEYYNLTDTDLSGINLTHVCFKDANLSRANLRGAQFDSTQFLHALGLQTVTDIDEEKSNEIRRAFFENANGILVNIENELQGFETTLNDIEKLKLLHTEDGELPYFTELTDDQVRSLIILALGNKNINQLPAASPFCYTQLIMYREQNGKSKLADQTREQLINLLHQLMPTGKNQGMGWEVIALAQFELITSLFNNLDLTKEQLDFLESVSNAWNFGAETSFSQRFSQAQETYLQRRAQKCILLNQYKKQLIDTFVAELFNPPNDMLGYGDSERLHLVLEEARHDDEMAVDLSAVDVVRFEELFKKNVDISHVFLKLTPIQERALYEINKLYVQQRYIRFNCAIDNNNLSEVQICVEQGLNPNQPNDVGRTPFMRACMVGNPAIVQFLLANRANVHLKTDAGWTIIESVSRRRNHAVAELLINKGATLDFISRCCLYGEEALQNKTVAEINQLHHSGESLLHIAVLEQLNDLITPIITMGGKVDIENAQHQTPLYLAVQHKNDEAVTLLVEHKAVVTNRMIYLACENKRYEMAKLLREHISEPIDLYTAMFFREWDLLTQLISTHHIDADFWNGMTPLALACSMGHVDVVRWLLDKGANLYVCVNAKLPITYAFENAHTEVIALFLEKGFSMTAVIRELPPAIHVAVDSGHLPVVSIILEHYKKQGQPQLESVANCAHAGRTPLLKAAMKGNMPIIQVLLDAGADPYATDAGGNSVLHLAADAGNNELIRLQISLLVQRKNRSGESPLDMAKESGHTPTQALLSEFIGDAKAVSRQSSSSLAKSSSMTFWRPEDESSSSLSISRAPDPEEKSSVLELGGVG